MLRSDTSALADITALEISSGAVMAIELNNSRDHYDKGVVRTSFSFVWSVLVVVV